MLFRVKSSGATLWYNLRFTLIVKSNSKRASVIGTLINFCIISANYEERIALIFLRQYSSLLNSLKGLRLIYFYLLMRLPLKLHKSNTMGMQVSGNARGMRSVLGSMDYIIDNAFSFAGALFGREFFIGIWPFCIAVGTLCLIACICSLLNIMAISINRYYLQA